ncbi:MAG TPA: replication initiator [Acidimicrobiales bacterium]|nr:replication initiator [Acidimicrobiales bacterium]
MTVLLPDELTVDAVGGAALESAHRRTRGCARPIRLVGSTTRLDAATGQLLAHYSSASELDGITYVRCGDRRAHRCESCSREYKGDAWHLLQAGLAGGKGVPDTVTDHPATFVTLTAPSFGPVHGLRQGRTCRPRRDKPTCPHGRPSWCVARHDHDDHRLGEPLCRDCYDYRGHVLWQWHAPELWRRFGGLLRAALARQAGLTKAGFRARARLSYTKVVEFQARGVIHVHVVVRLDGPDGPDTPPGVDLDAGDIGAAVHDVAAAQRYTATPQCWGPTRLRWGAQVDTRPITSSAGRDDRTGGAHPGQVAAYLAKYLTKSTEDFGLDAQGRVHSAAHARKLDASPHAVRLIETAEDLAAHGGPDYQPLAARYGTLGYRGHPITKSRRYSVTFGALRRARRIYRQRPAGLDPDATIRDLPADDDPAGDESTVVVHSTWAYVGSGYLDIDQAAQALVSACRARARVRRDP